jgi:hypothetical protein
MVNLCRVISSLIEKHKEKTLLFAQLAMCPHQFLVFEKLFLLEIEAGLKSKIENLIINTELGQVTEDYCDMSFHINDEVNNQL